jgi:hypothetical protein
MSKRDQINQRIKDRIREIGQPLPQPLSDLYRQVMSGEMGEAEADAALFKIHMHINMHGDTSKAKTYTYVFDDEEMVFTRTTSVGGTERITVTNPVFFVVGDRKLGQLFAQARKLNEGELNP